MKQWIESMVFPTVLTNHEQIFLFDNTVSWGSIHIAKVIFLSGSGEMSSDWIITIPHTKGGYSKSKSIWDSTSSMFYYFRFSGSEKYCSIKELAFSPFNIRLGNTSELYFSSIHDTKVQKHTILSEFTVILLDLRLLRGWNSKSFWLLKCSRTRWNSSQERISEQEPVASFVTRLGR
jgi:hypothetical protein